jgi:hypothetical protein
VNTTSATFASPGWPELLRDANENYCFSRLRTSVRYSIRGHPTPLDEEIKPGWVLA